MGIEKIMMNEAWGWGRWWIWRWVAPKLLNPICTVLLDCLEARKGGWEETLLMEKIWKDGSLQRMKEGLRKKMKPSILTCNPSLTYVWEDKKKKKWKGRRVAPCCIRGEKNAGRWWMGYLMGVEFGPLHAGPCYLDKSWKGTFGLIGLDMSWVGSNWFRPKHRI